MSDVAIKVENVSKLYHIGLKDSDNLRDSLAKGLRVFLGKKEKKSDDEFWALKNVSFEVKHGEVVGIIGRNGAGKSTLLKVLSRITEPSSGRIEINGRVASLLEVGTGFHPELTGRENIFMNGSILGMKQAEVRKKFDEIVDFSGVEKFIDTPVKHYSSGMYVRLAFAVAAHLEPEILIIDEVLAVGDVEFQKKCLGKMQDVSKKEGRTVLFVSHNMAAVQQLTQKSVLLKNGVIAFYGDTIKAINEYVKVNMNFQELNYNVSQTLRAFDGLQQQVKFIKLGLKGALSRIIPVGKSISIMIDVLGQERVDNFRFSGTIFRNDDIPVGSFFSPENSSVQKGDIVTFELELSDLRLTPGQYHFGFAVGFGNNKTGTKEFDIVMNVVHFEIASFDGDDGTFSNWPKNWGPIQFLDPVLNVKKTRPNTI